MTVCIAAIHDRYSDPKIITCTDGRLDYGDYGSGTSGEKSQLLGYEWFALLSGAWNEAHELARHIGEKLRSRAPLKSRSDALHMFGKSCESFKKTPFFTQSITCDLIIGGFIGRDPMLISAGIRDGNAYANVSGDTAIVGSGAVVAQTILNIRDYSHAIDPRKAVYIIYEAKKLSETVVSVGPKTWIEIHRPVSTPAPASGSVNVQWPLPGLFEKLDALCGRFGLQPINLEDLPSLQSPTGDLSPPLTLPESPGGSGES